MRSARTTAPAVAVAIAALCVAGVSAPAQPAGAAERWTAAVPLSPSPPRPGVGTYDSTTVAVDDRGAVLAAWYEYDASRRRRGAVRIREFDAAGRGGRPGGFARPDPGSRSAGVTPQVALDGRGGAVVVWTSRRGRFVEAAVRAPGRRFVRLRPLPVPPGATAVVSSVSLLPGGTAGLIWGWEGRGGTVSLRAAVRRPSTRVWRTAPAPPRRAGGDNTVRQSASGGAVAVARLGPRRHVVHVRAAAGAPWRRVGEVTGLLGAVLIAPDGHVLVTTSATAVAAPTALLHRPGVAGLRARPLPAGVTAFRARFAVGAGGVVGVADDGGGDAARVVAVPVPADADAAPSPTVIARSDPEDFLSAGFVHVAGGDLLVGLEFDPGPGPSTVGVVRLRPGGAVTWAGGEWRGCDDSGDLRLFVSPAGRVAGVCVNPDDGLEPGFLRILIPGRT